MESTPRGALVEFDAPDVRVGRRRKTGIATNPSKWRTAKSGLQYSSFCRNADCEAFRKKSRSLVLCQKGFGVFRPSEDIDHDEIRCPTCSTSCELGTFIFYKCSARIDFCLKGEKPQIIQISQAADGEYLELGHDGKSVAYTSLIIDCREVGVYEEKGIPAGYTSVIDGLIINKPQKFKSMVDSECDSTKSWSLRKVAIVPCNTMNPGNILFSQDTIARQFRCGRGVQMTMQLLRDNKILPEDIPTIQVFEWKGKVHSASNRRLWAFKEAGVTEVPITKVSLSTIDPDKLSTKNGGVSVQMRGN